MKDSTGNVFAITVSQGLPSRQSGEDAHSLVSLAYDALYKGKENGRSRVETSTGLAFLAASTNETLVICGRVTNALSFSRLTLSLGRFLSHKGTLWEGFLSSSC